jgi:hypothetical protein
MAEKYTSEQRESLVSAYRMSGQTQNKWCRENGVCRSTLGKWLKNEEAKPVIQQNWIPVQIKSPVCQASIVIEVGKCKIKVDEGFSKALFKEIVEVLMTVC